MSVCWRWRLWRRPFGVNSTEQKKNLKRLAKGLTEVSPFVIVRDMESNGHSYSRYRYTEDMICRCGAVYGPDPANDLPCPGEPVYDDPQEW